MRTLLLRDDVLDEGDDEAIGVGSGDIATGVGSDDASVSPLKAYSAVVLARSSSVTASCSPIPCPSSSS